MKSVLSIDGDGIRGYSSLVILQALMEKVGEVERARDPMATSSIFSPALGTLDDAKPMSEYWPCHYFDFIAGVGTGGIITIMLGRCRMSVREAMERYRDVCALVVEQQQLMSPQPKYVPWSVLSVNRKVSTRLNLELVPRWPSPDEDDGELGSDLQRCHTIVCGCDGNLQPLRSYSVSSEETQKHTIDDVILKCVREPPPPRGSYIDAKHIYNNPSRTVLSEISHFCNREECGDCSIDLLSIGGGGAINKPVDRRASELQYRMSKQSRLVHEELLAAKRGDGFNLNHYCRLEVLDDDDSLQDVGVENGCKPGGTFSSSTSSTSSSTSFSNTFDRIEKATTAYLRQDKATADELYIFATALVEKRRLRAETERWGQWALGVSS